MNTGTLTWTITPDPGSWSTVWSTTSKPDDTVTFNHGVAFLEGTEYCVNITYVEVDRELAYADVYVSVMDGPERQREIMDALKRATGFIRSQLARSISHLRTFPQVRFHWDPVPERVERLDQIFAELDEEEGFDEQDE
jgi:ribosome-binding factor A